MPSSSPLPRSTDSAVVRRCVYCGAAEGEPHTRRCSVTKHGALPTYEEPRANLVVERDRLRSALEQLDGHVGAREQAIITQTLYPPGPADQQSAA